MVVRFTEKATNDYANAPADVRRAFKQQLGLLLANLHHPSLRARKYSEANYVWQARVNRDWRFYFRYPVRHRRDHHDHSAPQVVG